MLTPSEKLAGARRSYAAFSAGPDIDALLPLYDRECEWHLGPMRPASAVARSRSMFSCDIAYSRSPTASRASPWAL
jgi:ketosteroid isomerase-like protein